MYPKYVFVEDFVQRTKLILCGRNVGNMKTLEGKKSVYGISICNVDQLVSHAYILFD